ncbi:hypothetical protein CPC735_041830 [Coccidioides posadasii C735 delta SOWgp]|uniref:Uncharacterized protein n=1 Tax=Coccidioides posadasii (strain C735) TaxID=222929 RepID=C5PAV5_COCP7|nr:hypothetical protein CPC735_041830 [Coccidioides posadasii C735 delta SOWgp]EER25739.1 hypothetical protein CPC735_041830 [Coccidioides posadasii C735 delta SOWgp]|eukprot:XP_003067884.1 hypothetical protein CPC735_041830 [Coccidioides posadasii C735 delta SOWgp]
MPGSNNIYWHPAIARYFASTSDHWHHSRKSINFRRADMVLVEHGLLEPPDLSTIINDHDQLQPTPQQLEIATERSRDYWYHLTAMAISRHRTGIPPTLTSLRNILNRVPAISTRQGKTMILHLGSSPSETLCIQTSSVWHVTGTAKCGLVGKKREIPGLLHIGSRTPIPCGFSGESFRQWPSISGEGNRAPSYLGILALGWSYILSARLLELQVDNSEMAYTDSKPTRIRQGKSHDCSSPVTIDIGKVDEDVARWWCAILAPGQGWKAIISRQMDQEFVTPWSVSINDMHDIEIRWESKEPVSKGFAASSPPPSKKAFENLAQFSQRHNLDSQLPVALATALTFPAHNYHGTAIQLPLPLPLPANNHTQQGVDSVNSTALSWLTVDNELPYYMTLSCSPETVISALCGMFWEPTVTCNMVSPWLHPIFQEIPKSPKFSSTPGFYYEILAVICSFRQPRIFTLWLGAVTSGLAPIILRRVERGRPPVDPNAFPWTGCPQSFMDLPGSGPYISNKSSDKVQRADVWRLLYLPPVVDDELYYNNPPFTPWAPFGSTTAGQCVLRVATHLQCPRHYLEYAHWNWILENGSIVEGQGFDKTSSHRSDESSTAINMLDTLFPQRSPTQEASREASLDIFRWVMINGEGTPPEKIYRDEWLQLEDESDEETGMSDDENSASHASDERLKGLEEWLGQPTALSPVPSFDKGAKRMETGAG